MTKLISIILSIILNIATLYLTVFTWSYILIIPYALSGDIYTVTWFGMATYIIVAIISLPVLFSIFILPWIFIFPELWSD